MIQVTGFLLEALWLTLTKGAMSPGHAGDDPRRPLTCILTVLFLLYIEKPNRL
jgi:hypothetical protein